MNSVLMWLLIIFVFLILVCSVFACITIRKMYAGILHIDVSDPETDRYMLEITSDLDKLPKKRRVIFAIDPNYVSQNIQGS